MTELDLSPVLWQGTIDEFKYLENNNLLNPNVIYLILEEEK